jgi:ssDNA-binding Zn-finger/Zn-ribbon topoisomerase 1
MSATHAVREGWREGTGATSNCLVCSQAVASRKARYCSRACQQRAYRLRQQPPTSREARALRQDLQWRGRLTAHTVYACPSCEERFLGTRRCADCNRFCQALGLGGRCPDCDAPILLRELLDFDLDVEVNH